MRDFAGFSARLLAFVAVLAFAAPRASKRVMAIKGAAGTRPSIQVTRSKVKGSRLWIVGVDGIKATVFERLARGKLMRFSDTLAPIFYEQLTSERRVLRYSRGRPVRRFERIPGRARVEALDATVYAFAARAAVNLALEVRAEELRQVTPPPQATGVYRSAFVNR